MCNESQNKVAIVKELKDPANTHKYTFNNIIAVVNNRLSKANLKLGYKSGFNSYVLSLFIEFYNIKDDNKYSYKHSLGNYVSYTYSEKLVDLLCLASTLFVARKPTCPFAAYNSLSRLKVTPCLSPR